MNITSNVWTNPVEYLRAQTPDYPVHFFAPQILRKQAERFLEGFNGLVTYAVKANPEHAVITNLVATGIKAFDVASPNEIKLLRALSRYPEIIESSARLRSPHQLAYYLQSLANESYFSDDVDQVADGRGAMRVGDIGVGSIPRLDTVKEVLDVGSGLGVS